MLSTFYLLANIFLVACYGDTFQDYQHTSMQLFMEQKITWEDICQRTGITCEENSIRSIAWNHFHQHHYAIEWLPHSIIELRLEDVDLRGTIDTRKLPQNLALLYLLRNFLEGSVDLDSLPKNVQQIQIFRNNLNGTVSLLALPVNLRVLNLSWNSFDLLVYSNFALPKELAFVLLNHSNGMGRLCVDLDEQRMDDRIKLKRIYSPFLTDVLGVDF